MTQLRTKLLVAVAMIVTAASATLAGVVGAAAAPQAPPAAVQPDFGPNVRIFDPSMPTSEIQATVNAIRDEQVDAEMGTQRYALLFKPGTYGSPTEPLIIQVGYYTEVAGLGASPADVVINGHVDVYNRCLAPDNCIALVNFWRSVSNLTINIMGETGCRASANFWAASQAAPMRRVNVTGGNLTLFDYCTAGPQFASGGFIADSKTGFVINGSQQQYIVRNSSIGGWSNAVWNQVFAGVQGAPAQTFPSPPYTTLATTPVSREKPYLYVDAEGTYTCSSPTPAPTRRAPRGRPVRRPESRSPFGLLPGEAIGLRQDHQHGARTGEAPALDAWRLRRRPLHQRQAIRHCGAGPWRTHAHGGRAPCRCGSQTSRVSTSPAS